MSTNIELDAMNQILSVTGDAAVSSTSSTYEQAIIAKRILNEVSKEEQARGWWFNELDQFEKAPDGNGYINLPSDTLRCELPNDYGRYVQRGFKIFNKVENTDVFTESVILNLVTELTFINLPQSFRQYIVALAKLRYNAEYFGSPVAEAAIQKDITRYRLEVEREDIDNRDLNMVATTRGYNIAFKNRR
jgi:hypothetical protein